MFIESAELDPRTGIEGDLCIIGAGAAGITLALELRNSGLETLLVEGGGLELERANQQLHEVKQIGVRTDPLHANRLRVFGGTTGHWGGWVFPFDEIDFEERPWVPHSGWPFPRSELDEGYAAAHRILGIENPDYDYRRWLTDEDRSRGLIESSILRNFVIHLSRPPMRMGSAYRETFERDRNVRVLLHTNVVELEVNETASSVQRVRAATLDGKELPLRARRFVLAAGAVENARLLLASNSVQKEGLGNDMDLVGRFFMQHSQVSKALWATRAGSELFVARRSSRRDARIATALTAEAIRANEMLNYHFLVFGGRSPHHLGRMGAVREAIHQLRAIYTEEDIERDICTFLLGVEHEEPGQGSTSVSRLIERPEQAPNPDSRILLGEERDALGMRRAVMDWRLGELDRHTFLRGRQLVTRELGRLGLGRVRDWPEGYDPTVPSQEFLHGGHHHLGTARMHDDPRRGVVDRDCRVHGIENLYVTGGAVFPTSGIANPTLTIMAIAARLARELRRRFREA